MSCAGPDAHSMGIAELQMYAPEHALKGGYLYDEWDPDLVRELVDNMTPRSARLDLQTRAYDTLTERIQQVCR